MSRKCDLTGKGKLKGNKISHSHIMTIKHSKPNLRKVRVVVNGRVQTLKVSIRAYKTIRNGKIKSMKIASSVKAK